jgi:Fe-S-cluster containining protein
MNKMHRINLVESPNSGALPQPEVTSTPRQLEHQSAAPSSVLTLEQIRQEYPCDSCSAPCCSYLPLHTFTISNIRELDHALYLLNFPRIELGLSATGEWGVYYRYPCRFLDRSEGACLIYGDESRPSICVHYSPYSCWYKRVVLPNVHETFLRIDKTRMDALVEQLTFDEDHNLVGIPDWATMHAMFEKLPVSETLDEEFVEDLFFEQWLYTAAYGTPKRANIELTHSYTSLHNPCTDCGAHCCNYLIFPQPAPTTRVRLDYLQFVLGFPGIEVGVSDGDWVVIVQTRCQHLSDNCCSLFGKPERPQICTFYDAHGCQYIAQFGVPRPDDFMRIKLEQFYWLVEPMKFDRFGNVTYMPTTEELRRHVEVKWHRTVLAEAERAGLGFHKDSQRSTVATLASAAQPVSEFPRSLK